jgi:hypothetical protein
MPRYDLYFSGRRVGAIGITHPVLITVEADNEMAAALKAYDTHEHIAGGVNGVRVSLAYERKVCPVCGQPINSAPCQAQHP